ncbi:chromate efflux transporter [Shewanella sp. Isolate11]|nr:chromate efflux transporter [Shewanella sp. Isolate11]
MWLIFHQFFVLGLVSFGGPAAHIGYFKKRFVDELHWLDAHHYSSFVALSQVVPGPGSSQVGFAIGYHKGGLLGALSAFVGFTLPSFVLMYFLAVGSVHWLDMPWFTGLIHGLKLMAVVVVFDAVITMLRQFCRHLRTQVLMMLAAVITLWSVTLWSQLAVLIAAAFVGRLWLTPEAVEPSTFKVAKSSAKKTKQSSSVSDETSSNLVENTPNSPSQLKLSLRWLIVFGLLFIVTLLLLQFSQPLSRLFAQFYQAGALVFGGGHVVLPLLEMSVGQSMDSERFLTGYAMAQAVPGPMFSLAAFLGAELVQDAPLVGALIATMGIFLPGFLLVLTVFHHWQLVMSHPSLRGAISGVNAAVVGLLLAALISPVISSAMNSLVDLLLVLVGWVLLKQLRLNILWLLLFFSVCGVGLSLLPNLL